MMWPITMLVLEWGGRVTVVAPSRTPSSSPRAFVAGCVLLLLFRASYCICSSSGTWLGGSGLRLAALVQFPLLLLFAVCLGVGGVGLAYTASSCSYRSGCVRSRFPSCGRSSSLGILVSSPMGDVSSYRCILAFAVGAAGAATRWAFVNVLLVVLADFGVYAGNRMVGVRAVLQSGAWAARPFCPCE